MVSDWITPSLRADGILAVHLAWVSFIVLMVPLILLGGLLQWKWVRHRRLRMIHLGMLVYVIGESLLGIPCPLTVWENRLRQEAGQLGYDESFMGHWMRKVLYYDFSPEVFTVLYVAFGVLLLGLFWWVPPEKKTRWHRQ